MKKKKQKKEKEHSPLNPNFEKKLRQILPKEMNDTLTALYELATKDEKTKVYNTHFFNTSIEIEMEKAKRNNEDLSLLMLDIDKFKEINEIYGHIEADKILLYFANTLKKQTRKSDILARFGGDEFLILLPKTNKEKAIIFAKRLRLAVSKSNKLKKYGIKISGGIASMKKDDSKNTFITRANKALVKSKKKGRDQFNLE